MEEQYTWVDTDCGVDDALAILLALKYSHVLGISAIYGNTSVDNVAVNIQRVFTAFKSLYPNTPEPKFCISSRRCTNGSAVKTSVDNNGPHGRDGLGDAGEFMVEYGIDSTKYQFVDFHQAITEAIKFCKEHGKTLKFITIGPMTAAETLVTAENVDFYGMCAAVPEIIGITPDSSNQGSFARFGRPYCETNVGCDVAAAATVFSGAKSMTFADKAVTTVYQAEIDELVPQNCKTALAEFYRAITINFREMFVKYCHSAKFRICDAFTSFCCLFPEKCTFTQCGITVNLDKSNEHYGQTCAEPTRSNCYALKSLDFGSMKSVIRGIFVGSETCNE